MSRVRQYQNKVAKRIGRDTSEIIDKKLQYPVIIILNNDIFGFNK
jgi:hypothetical protein